MCCRCCWYCKPHRLKIFKSTDIFQNELALLIAGQKVKINYQSVWNFIGLCMYTLIFKISRKIFKNFCENFGNCLVFGKIIEWLLNFVESSSWENFVENCSETELRYSLIVDKISKMKLLADAIDWWSCNKKNWSCFAE